MYEMLTGRRAFAGDSEASVISAHHDERASARLVAATGHAARRRPTRTRCLAKAPDQRCESAHDLADELRSIAHGAVGPPGAFVGWRRLTVKRRRAAAWWAGLTGVALLAVGIAGLRDGLLPARTAGPVLTSLAVLPLVDSSADPSATYLADGMTEALIDELKRYSSLEHHLADIGDALEPGHQEAAAADREGNSASRASSKRRSCAWGRGCGFRLD